jgi:hypothetical protein
VLVARNLFFKAKLKLAIVGESLRDELLVKESLTDESSAEASSKVVPGVMELPSTLESLTEESSLREVLLRLALSAVALTSRVTLSSDRLKFVSKQTKK